MHLSPKAWVRGTPCVPCMHRERERVITLRVYFCRFAGSDENANKSVHLKLAVHNYTQSILDSTYFQECTLTGAEFSDKTSFEQIAAINQALSLPAQLCSSVGQVAELLGTDLLECLYWRVGALLYMFCHSMYEREEGKRKEIDRDVFLKVSLP